jgi:putative methionine-R-sulfoxide reductase with GAF domain
MEYSIAEQKIKNLMEDAPPTAIVQTCIDFLYDNFSKYSWIGIYIVKNNNLILGPWRGNQATEHTKIPIGKGICGSAANTGKTELISDVTSDNRYLSCFASTRSEIVVPIKKNGKIIGEIDIDSDIPDGFDQKDAVFLEKIADMLAKHI